MRAPVTYSKPGEQEARRVLGLVIVRYDGNPKPSSLGVSNLSGEADAIFAPVALARCLVFPAAIGDNPQGLNLGVWMRRIGAQRASASGNMYCVRRKFVTAAGRKQDNEAASRWAVQRDHANKTFG